MLDSALRVAPAAAACDHLTTAYRWMLLARLLEEKMASLYRAGKITGGVFVGRGQEALSVSIGMTLQKGDIFAPLIRDQAGRLAFGEPLLDSVRTYLGSRLGPMRGRDGNVHRGRPREGLLPMISHLGAMISAVCGTLIARRFKGEGGVIGATCLGEGGTSTGAFHEAMNLAAVERLPLLMIVANNQYAYSTPTERQFACAHLCDRAAGYGIAGHQVDGTDLEACLKTLSIAADQARNGGGPQLIVAHLLRLAGHGEHDDASYISEELKASPLGRDCLDQAAALLLERGWASQADLSCWRDEALQQIEEAVATVQREAPPDPNTEHWSALATERLIDGHALPPEAP